MKLLAVYTFELACVVFCIASFCGFFWSWWKSCGYGLCSKSNWV